MSENGLFGFCLLAVCFLLQPGLAQVREQVPEPAQCLVSRMYSLTRLPESKDDHSCYHDCLKERDCHMAVVTRPVSGPSECLLVNCLNQGQHSYPRDPSAKISVYPKSTLNNEQRTSLMKHLYAVDDETGRCYDIMTYSSCQSGIPKFFYNSTSYRCEQFYTGCGSNRNTFNTQEACEALCSQKFLCYRPMEHGQPPPFRFTDVSDNYDESIPNKIFYNVSSSRCEGFYFRGSASNGNIFNTVEECERFCAGVKDLTVAAPTEGTVPTTIQPAVDSDLTVAAPTEGTVPTTIQPAVDSDLTVAAPTEGTVPMTVQPAVDSDLTVAAPTEGTVPTTIQPAVDSDTTVAAPSDRTDVAAPVTSSISVVFLWVLLVILLLLTIAVIAMQCGRLFPRSPDRYQRLADADPAQ